MVTTSMPGSAPSKRLDSSTSNGTLHARLHVNGVGASPLRRISWGAVAARTVTALAIQLVLAMLQEQRKKRFARQGSNVRQLYAGSLLCIE
jgi:hypothetical protein